MLRELSLRDRKIDLRDRKIESRVSFLSLRSNLMWFDSVLWGFGIGI